MYRVTPVMGRRSIGYSPRNIRGIGFFSAILGGHSKFSGEKLVFPYHFPCSEKQIVDVMKNSQNTTWLLSTIATDDIAVPWVYSTH